MASDRDDAHLPRPVEIQSYGAGGFRFVGLDGLSHRGSLLALPSGMWAWKASSLADLTPVMFERAAAEAGAIDMLLVGTGRDLVPLPAALRAWFGEVGLRADPMATGAAVRTWNILLGERRRVAAALLAVD
ncbi:MAG: MTH938/NDUFAF3 family protein [Siculibacillus sp.]|nr:MTH938/NDUFAF3 family protein [Siculibacillus sp.]